MPTLQHGGGCQHIIFTKFSEKLLSYIKHPAYLIVLWLPTHKYTHIAVEINKAILHEIEKILVRRGAPGVPPLRSATDILLDVS